jgi:hypothetical protein
MNREAERPQADSEAMSVDSGVHAGQTLDREAFKVGDALASHEHGVMKCLQVLRVSDSSLHAKLGQA